MKTCAEILEYCKDQQNDLSLFRGGAIEVKARVKQRETETETGVIRSVYDDNDKNESVWNLIVGTEYSTLSFNRCQPL